MKFLIAGLIFVFTGPIWGSYLANAVPPDHSYSEERR